MVAPREILIDGKAPGTISLIVWGDSQRAQYDLVVEQAVAPLQQQLQALFPGEAIEVSVSDDATILSGQVSSTNVMLRAAEIAKASASKRAVINMLQVPGGSESQQVLLQVRFAEVNRRILTELGVSLCQSATLRRPVDDAAIEAPNSRMLKRRVDWRFPESFLLTERRDRGLPCPSKPRRVPKPACRT